MTQTSKPASGIGRLRPLREGYAFGLYAPGEFRSPDGKRWLALVHGHGSETGPEHDWMYCRCMRSGQHLTFPLNGSWSGCPVTWEHVEKELGIQDPYAGKEMLWDPHNDHLEFSTLARAVYTLAREHDLPAQGEIGQIARKIDWRAERNPALPARYGQAHFAASVLDQALPGLVEVVRDGKQIALPQPRPKNPARALRAAVDAAARAQMHGAAAHGHLDPILTPAQSWTASGWAKAARELPLHIERASEQFQARYEGERNGQRALFNALALAA
jgi:hypothetical protein